MDHDPEYNVLYLCDKRACKVCGPDCTHTHDITHAKNFELVGNGYFEKTPTVVFRINQLVSEKTRAYIREELQKQLDGGGIVLVDSSIEVLDAEPRQVTLVIAPMEDKNDQQDT